ncbi:hypothetical protein TU94_27175 [Streptomyces cyaneogriseus subsp. noncyanogenus]|uniref:Uncharacterized protein n=1 Tax=Streptomyces cyaneogriseus subsp. noncyanogenus TaxID=477245 RepID=A0A0C5GJG1_9ACTN|nr:hypothetical protein TU94_27175 [Streptomyces cyaneogriseus subsp. noncyanogenus]
MHTSPTHAVSPALTAAERDFRVSLAGARVRRRLVHGAVTTWTRTATVEDDEIRRWRLAQGLVQAPSPVSDPEPGRRMPPT